MCLITNLINSLPLQCAIICYSYTVTSCTLVLRRSDVSRTLFSGAGEHGVCFLTVVDAVTIKETQMGYSLSLALFEVMQVPPLVTTI